MLQLTFLGTSAGVPTKQRNVTALAVECLNPYATGSKGLKSRPWLLVDCGEGTQQQLLQTKLSLRQLTAICITHVHGDHCYGLPGLLASAAMSGRHEALTIIAPKAIATFLDAVTFSTELYFPFAINFMAIEDILSEQDGKISVQLDTQHQIDIDITCLSHRVPSHAFGITQTLSHSILNTDKLKAESISAGAVWGKLQKGNDIVADDGKPLYSRDYVDQYQQRTRVIVAGDNDKPECLISALEGTDLLVHEATYTSEVLAKIQAKFKDNNPDFDPMHSSAQQVGKFAQDNGIKNLILTHFSARYQSFDNPNSSTANMAHIRLDAESVYHGNLWLADDFAQYLITGATSTLTHNTNSRVEYLGSARD